MSVALHGTDLLVAEAENGLHCYDVTDPEHPVPAGSLDTPGVATSVCCVGDLAYVADSWAESGS